jgi:UbiD family decarboxylase
MTDYYKNVQEYVDALERNGLLRRITRPINKDTELNALVRLQYRGLPAEQRTAFLFENVIDSTGRRYEAPVMVACFAGTRAIYALGMNCPIDKIDETWSNAQKAPIAPVYVDEAPVQEVVLEGEELLASGGVLAFPTPISTPGFDNAPYMSAAHWVTRDPDTGGLGMGNYRGQIKTATRVGCFAGKTQDLVVNWKKWRALGRPMEAAIVLGVTPNLSYAAVTKLPHDVEEYAVAGAMAGTPVPLVRCKSVDIDVPADAEIVIEGVISTTELEEEGPFGEFTGYMGARDTSLFMEVTCITRRNAPIYQAFHSQFPPSESTILRGVGKEGVIFDKLVNQEGLTGVLDVVLQEEAGSYGMCVLVVDTKQDCDVRRALEIVGRDARLHSKVAVAVDPDIDPRDPASVNWAMSFAMQPHRDAWVVPVQPLDLDYSARPPQSRGDLTSAAPEGSSLLIDATRKWAYPPVSLPKRQFMERALEIWQEEGFPEVKLRQPWYGYELGHWSETDREQAKLATESRYAETGAAQEQKRRLLGEGE